MAGEGLHSTCGLGADGPHRGHGDNISIDFEIAALGRRQRQELGAGKLRHIRQIDGHALGLRADVRVPAIGARTGQGDSRALDVRRTFQGSLGIGDAFLDAAGGEGDEESLRRLRGAHQDLCLLVYREELVRREIVFGDGGAVVNLAAITIDRFDIRIHFSDGPSTYGALQLIIASLLVRDVCIHVDALVCQGCLGAIIQGVHAVLHIGLEALEFIVLALHLGDHPILLLLRGFAAAFEDGRIGPSHEFLLSVLVVEVRVVVVHERAIGGESHGAAIGNDAVEIQIAAGIGDRNISFRLRLEAVVLPFPGLCLHCEGIASPADGAAGGKLHAVRCDDGIRLLGNIAVGRNRNNAAGGDRTGGDAMVLHVHGEVLRRAAADSLGTGADSRVLGAGTAGGSRHGEAAGIDVAAGPLGDGCPRESGLTFAVREGAIDDHVSAAAIDIQCAAGFIAEEIDADAIACAHRILRQGGIGFLFYQREIKFLLESQAGCQTLGRLVERYGLLPGYIGFARNLYTTIGRSGGVLQMIAISDDRTAIQSKLLPRLVTRNGATRFKHILTGRCLIKNAKQVEFFSVKFVGGDGTAILAGLEAVVKVAAIRIFLRSIGGSLTGSHHRIPRRIAIGITLDGLGDRTIVSSVGGLAEDLAARAVEIGDFDLPFRAFASGECAKLDVLVAPVVDHDLAITVQGFDSRLAGVIGGIDDGAHDGNLPAVDFYVVHDEAAGIQVIRELVGCLAGGSFYTDRMARGIPIDRSLVYLIFAIHIVELVIRGNRQIPIGDTALDGGIDIDIASADENISIGQDATAQGSLLSAIIQRCTANAENALGIGHVALDVITIVNLHVHGAAIDGAIGVDVAVLAGNRHAASGIVNVAQKIHIRCSIQRNVGGIIAFHLGVVGGLEGIPDGDRRRRAAFAVSGGDSKGNNLLRILIGFLDGIGHISFERYIVVEDGAALAGAGGPLASHYLHIAHLEIVRRCIGDGDLCVTTGQESAAAGYIVPFKEDVPQLGSDFPEGYIVSDQSIVLAVKEVIRATGQIAIRIHLGRVTINIYRDDFRTGLSVEFPILLCAACSKEGIGGIDLIGQRRHILLERRIPIRD